MKRLHVFGEDFDGFGRPLVEQADVDVQSEIDFWSDQLMEHAMIMSVGFADAEARNGAEDLAIKFKQFIDSGSEAEDRTGQVRELSKELRDFQTGIIERLNSGEWIGWLTPTFMDHITRELDYFMQKIEAPLDREKELSTWLPLLKEHSGTMANLLDPQEEGCVEKFRLFTEQFSGMSPETDFSEIQRAAMELDSFLDTEQKRQEQGDLKSVIHPMLLHHVIDEGQYFLNVLKNLK